VRWSVAAIAPGGTVQELARPGTGFGVPRGRPAQGGVDVALHPLEVLALFNLDAGSEVSRRRDSAKSSAMVMFGLRACLRTLEPLRLSGAPTQDRFAWRPSSAVETAGTDW
jgi:hypothetical protein